MVCVRARGRPGCLQQCHAQFRNGCARRQASQAGQAARPGLRRVHARLSDTPWIRARLLRDSATDARFLASCSYPTAQMRPTASCPEDLVAWTTASRDPLRVVSRPELRLRRFRESDGRGGREHWASGERTFMPLLVWPPLPSAKVYS
jgi:hypothetical protein